MILNKSLINLIRFICKSIKLHTHTHDPKIQFQCLGKKSSPIKFPSEKPRSGVYIYGRTKSRKLPSACVFFFVSSAARSLKVERVERVGCTSAPVGQFKAPDFSPSFPRLFHSLRELEKGGGLLFFFVLFGLFGFRCSGCIQKNENPILGCIVRCMVFFFAENGKPRALHDRLPPAARQSRKNPI